MLKKVLTLPSLLILLTLIVAKFPTSALAQETPRTTTVWDTSEDESPVTVIPYIWSGKDNVFFDFEAKNFSPVKYISYNFEYDTDEEAIKRGAEGGFDPNTNAYDGYYKNNPYFRHHLVLGTCSSNVCTYHKNPRNVRLSVTTEMKIGPVAKYTQVLKFPDDQF